MGRALVVATMSRRCMVSCALATFACGGDTHDGPGVVTTSGATASDDTTDAATSSADTSAGSIDLGGECEPAAPGPGIVVTDAGALAGIDLPGGGFALLGVPFAAPPTGALRFAAPAPVACWSDVRDATAHGPRCPQLDGEDGPVVGDEDCLTLDVWTPAADDGARPVLFFVHGGGNSLGGIDDPLYDGEVLARELDVVVVTTNYRLGALGFLADPSLVDGEGIAGNWGLMDLLAALEWTQANAAGLGGDPDRVLLFGQSAGAVDVCALLGVPRAQGLFAAAAVHSGTCRQREPGQYAMQTGTPFLAASGCAGADDVPECLRALTADAIVTTEPTGFPSVSALSQSWGPYVDGVLLPRSTLDAMAAGTHVDVPLVIGATAQETARDIPELTEAQYVAAVEASFGMVLGAMVLEQYPVADYATPTDAYIAVTSDAKFVCAARTAARAAAGQRSAVYRYHFAYDGYTTFGNNTATAFHGVELPYLFRSFAALGLPTNADDAVMIDQMGVAWTTFAATGTPALEGATWPAYDAALDDAALLDVPIGTVEGVRTAQCDFWDGLLPG